MSHSAGGPEGSGRKVWGPPNFFFSFGNQKEGGEVRLVQDLNHFGALRVRVKQRRREGLPTPPRRSERIPIICIMEMRSLYLDLD